MPRVQRSARAAFDRLAAYPGVRGLVAGVLSIGKTMKTRRAHVFSYDRRGWWVNRQRGTTFYSPTLHSLTLDHVRSVVEGYWCRFAPVAEGAVVVDVGAGVGDQTLVFSRLAGPSGRVVAIEAHPATAQCLRFTVERNALSNTTIIEAAAWDREDTLLISDDGNHLQNAIGRSAGVPVRARPVDAMLAPLALPRIDLVKMNIEGAEATALAGMKGTLARTGAVVVQCHDFLADGPDDGRRTKARVMALLEEEGFAVRLWPDAPYNFMRDTVYGLRSGHRFDGDRRLADGAMIREKSPGCHRPHA